LRHTDTQIRWDFLSYIKRLASLHSIEVCGLICENSLFFVKNSSVRPQDTFYIDPLKYIEVSRCQKIDFCFHSHPQSGCSPSVSDIALSDNSLIPFLVFSPSEARFALYDPDTQETIYFLI
jgi:proteasome lid subunit RPN8/RPN11